jgi:predicted SprT family Zn-dependent metalloprotease
MTPREQVLLKCKEVIAKAKALYGVDLGVVQIGFNLKGRVAGWAKWQRMMGVTKYTCRFNYDMISRGDAAALRDMMEDTVPHEFAHIVCYMKPELGDNHNSGWQRVCIALGGTGKRTHDQDVVFGRGVTYEYTSNRGCKIRLNEKRHQLVQAGVPLQYKKGLGVVNKACAYSIVGVGGRTLEQPIVKQATAVNAPASIEEFVRERMNMVQNIRITDLTGDKPKHSTLVLKPVQTVAPVVAPRPMTGESKAAVSRRIMLSGYRGGQSYEQIIQAMIAANGYDRQLARATFKANASKVGIPDNFYA